MAKKIDRRKYNRGRIPIYGKPMVQLSNFLCLPREMLRSIRKIAKQESISTGAFIRSAIESKLNTL
jgi:hypothetical protein